MPAVPFTLDVRWLTTGLPCRCFQSTPQELASGATLGPVKELLGSALPGWLAEFARLLAKPLSAEVGAAGLLFVPPAGCAC